MGPVPPTDNPAVRLLLRRILPTDAEFDAFCLDYFPSIKHRFSSSMDGVVKVNLLLEASDSEEVLQKLREAHPEKYRQQEAILHRQLPLFPVADKNLLAQIDELNRQRDLLRRGGGDTIGHDELIRSLKKQMRQGPQLSANEILGDRYTLELVLGSGGFANVWLAWDRILKKYVAVKVLHGRWGLEHEQWQRFSRGALTMARLCQEHPSLFVMVLSDRIQHDGGFHYFAMEYLKGGDLFKAVLNRTLTRSRALEAIIQVGAALHIAHEQGLIHRDVKPQNILIDGDGAARLTDFDLVMAPDTTGNTRTGGLGTFIYAAPEAMDDAARVDRRADVYSLGMTAAFVLHGQKLPKKILQSTDRFIEELKCTPPIKAVLHKALKWEIEERYPTVEAFGLALRSALTEKRSASDEAFGLALRSALTEKRSASDVFYGFSRENADDELVGRIVGPYEITHLIGRGGSSVVYLAQQREIGLRVAIKFLRPDQATHAVHIAHEARALSRQSHPSLVKIFAFEQLPDGRPYIIMEYLEGISLRTMIRDSGSSFPVKLVCQIVGQIASTVSALHAAGIIHRDIKPDNVMLVPDSDVPGGHRVKIFNFGIAQFHADRRDPWFDENTFTDETSSIVGTPLYMSPEACEGGALDAKTDVYSLGILFYEMLTGQPPFSAERGIQWVILQHIDGIPLPLRQRVPHVTEPLAAIVHTMLDKHPEYRPTMNEVATMLRFLPSKPKKVRWRAALVYLCVAIGMLTAFMNWQHLRWVDRLFTR